MDIRELRLLNEQAKENVARLWASNNADDVRRLLDNIGFNLNDAINDFINDAPTNEDAFITLSNI